MQEILFSKAALASEYLKVLRIVAFGSDVAGANAAAEHFLHNPLGLSLFWPIAAFSLKTNTSGIRFSATPCSGPKLISAAP